MQEKIKQFKDLTQDIVKFPTEEKQKDYLLLLNDIEFELAELSSKVPVMKEVLKNKVNERINEILEKWEQTAYNKATTQAELEHQDEKVEYTVKDAFSSSLKTYINIGERTYYYVKNELNKDIKTEQKTSDLPF